MAERSVLLAGGGTAGHVNPLLALAGELRDRDPGLRLTALGTAAGLESRLVPEHGLDLRVIGKVPLPRRPDPAWLHLPARLRAAVDAAAEAIVEVDAQVVVGFGGYVATPAYLAARRLGVPVVVHEQNARPGLANRLGARWAAEVAVTFPGTRLPQAQVTGLPLRDQIAGLLAARAADPEGTRLHAAAELGLDPELPTVLVTGGSLGAVSLNAAVADLAAELCAHAQVLHLTGSGKAEAVRQAVRGAAGADRYHVREYLAEMHQALAVADLVVCRAGAGTVCELAALGLPAVYVPLPVGNGEQRHNAAGVVAAGGGLLVDDARFTADWQREHLLPLLTAPDAAEVRAEMGRRAASVGVTDGAARLAGLVERQLRLAADRAEAERVEVERLAAEEAVAGRAVDADAVTELLPLPADRTPRLADLGPAHLVGVGGAGMSAIAELLAARGVEVSGCDARAGEALHRLRDLGLDVAEGHDPDHLVPGVTVVRSGAVRDDHPEILRARELGLPVLHRSEALAALMADRDAVAVAGAHGKTTTSAMAAVALRHAGLDPSWAIGGVVLDDDAAGERHPSGARHGEGSVLVAEADESDGSFLAYRPWVAVVTNVEPDHLDHYGSAAAVEEAFAAFAARVRPRGLLVACADDPGARRLVERALADELPLRVLTYGRDPGADLVLGETVAVGAAAGSGAGTGATTGSGADTAEWVTPFTLDGVAHELRLAVPGAHNALNAAAAYLAAVEVGADQAEVLAGLAGFRGTGRRFQDRGTAAGVRVVDDYAHHPTEVAALLRTAREVTEGRVLVLFQPHLYSRTREFADRFAEALSAADEVVVTDVYAAREQPDPEVSGATIADRMTGARYVADRLAAADAVADLARPGDLLLTVGAGDVTELGPRVLDRLAARAEDA